MQPSMQPSVQPLPSDLARLAHKYRTIGELRRARSRGEPVPERDVFRALSSEFPGVLSELDTLPLEEIDRRADSLALAAEGAAIEPWMAWIHAYHALMRAALFIRLRTARARSEITAAMAEKASERSGIRVDEAFAQTVARPPGGRINAVIYARLSAIFGVPATDVKRAIFPGLRDRIL